MAKAPPPLVAWHPVLDQADVEMAEFHLLPIRSAAVFGRNRSSGRKRSRRAADDDVFVLEELGAAALKISGTRPGASVPIRRELEIYS
eukprot:g9604.t1